MWRLGKEGRALFVSQGLKVRRRGAVGEPRCVVRVVLATVQFQFLDCAASQIRLYLVGFIKLYAIEEALDGIWEWM